MPWGAYGLALRGLASEGLVPAGLGAVAVDIHRRIGLAPDRPGESLVGMDERHAHLRLPEGRVEVDRDDAAITFVTPGRLLDHAVLHPYLAFPAAVFAVWQGRVALHAGAVVTADRAIALLGAKGAGKSTLVATLAQLGADVLTDDLLVVDSASLQAFAGPRSVDLRPDMATAATTVDIGVVGARPRHRFTPAPVPWSVPLSGVVHLRVGDGLAVQPVPAADRLSALAEVAALGPTRLPSLGALALAALPTWRLSRPRRAGTPITAPAELLLDLVA